jgi:hypothetical protein
MPRFLLAIVKIDVGATALIARKIDVRERFEIAIASSSVRG